MTDIIRPAAGSTPAASTINHPESLNNHNKETAGNSWKPHPGALPPKRVPGPVCRGIALACLAIVLLSMWVLFSGCATSQRSPITSIDCVDRTIASAEVYQRKHPDAEVFVVVGRHNDYEYHVEPVAEGVHFSFNFDMTDFVITPEQDMIQRIFTGPVKKYPYRVFKNGAMNHATFSRTQLEIYSACDAIR